MTPFQDEKMAGVFEAFEPDARASLLAVRGVIFDLAGEMADVEGVEESLKWGQPSYVPRPKTGTPIRLGLTKSDTPAIFVHCQTTLVSDLASDNAYGLETIDNRAVVLPSGDLAGHPGLRGFVRAALMYHR